MIKDTITVWVEQLGVFDLMLLCAETVFSGAVVRYDYRKATRGVLMVLSILQRFGICGNFKPAALDLNKKNASGHALNYSMESDLDECLNIFCKRYISEEEERFKSAVRLYVASFLTYRATFVTMVENDPEFKKEGRANIIYLTGHPLNSVITPFYKNKGHAIRESLFSTERIKYFMRPYYRLFSIILAKCSRTAVRTNIRKSRPSVWVEYAHNDTVDFTFWRDAIDGNKLDRVCYLDRNDGFSLEEEAGTIEKMGLKWIDLHFVPLVKLANIGIGQLRDMCRSLFSDNPGVPRWLGIFQFEFRMWYLLYRPVFERFKVKVLIEHQESLWIKDAQLKALEDAGGIMVGFHWSNMPYYKANLWSNPHHVYFVWGKVIYEWIEKRGNLCRYVLPSGLWLFRRQEKDISARLSDSVKFTLAIFDSSVAYNIYQSENTLSEFYLMILRLLESNPEWGGIMKNKSRSMADTGKLPHGKDISARIAALVSQKRLAYVDAADSPLDASTYADLSVCYGLNSAGIIAGAYGHKAVHWDCSGWLNHPFYRDKTQKFLFTALEEMEGAIYRANRGDASIGDFSRWRRRFNHFEDANASQRIGEFIQYFVEDVEITGNAEISVDKAVKRYRASHGVDETFFSTENIWETEKTGET